MRLVSHDTVPTEGLRYTFKSHSWRSLALAAIVIGAIAGYTAIPKGEPINPVLVALPLLTATIILLLMLFRLRLCRRPQNWLLRVTDEGLYINLRSYLYAHLPPESHQAVFLPRDEVAAVCKTHETRKLPYRHGYTRDRFSYVDFYVARGVDLAPLREALRVERRLARNAGFLHRSRHHDYPVRVLDPPGIRLVWDWIKPDENRALEMLDEIFHRAPDQVIEPTEWDALSDAEKDALIAHLWEIGDVDDAIRLVRMRQGVSDRVARAYVKEHIDAV